MHRNKWKWKHDNLKLTGFRKSSAKGNVCSNISLPQETREKINKWPNLTSKETRKKKKWRTPGLVEGKKS